jgi:hypothetical protein
MECHILDADGDNVTVAQLAIDRQVQHHEISTQAPAFALGPDRPNVIRLESWLRPDKLPLNSSDITDRPLDS